MPNSSKLKRSNITEIQNFGIIAEPVTAGFGYLVIEYIEDSAILKQFARWHNFCARRYQAILSTIADTLQYAHVSHILHGNLHPGNILLVRNCALISHPCLKNCFNHLTI